jgi:6-phospho-beta-glucosidase
MSKKGLKIVTIGGGSSYTPEFVEGIIKRYHELPVSEYWLVDIEEGREKLEIVGNLAKRMVEKAGLPIEVHLTLDRREALKDADFVTTQLRVGLLQARAKDERIPLSHGFMGQETNGAGGLFKGLRTVPVILEIANEMTELCPNAWLVNFTNPAGMVTEALARYSKHRKFVGLCNVPIGMERGIAAALEMDTSKVRVDFVGLNHMVYGVNVWINGEKKTAEALNEFIEKSKNASMKNIAALGWDPEFIKAFKLIPCPYHRYYYKSKDMLAEELEKFKIGKTRAEEVIETEKELFELYKDPNLNIKPPQLEKRGGAYYSDAACNLISSIYNDKGDFQVVNTLNNGMLKDFPNDYVIEVTSKITKDGPVPHRFTDELPVQIKGLISQIKQFEILGAQAAVEGSYEKALVAMVTNPLISNDEEGHKLLDEMLEAHKKYLPKFFDENGNVKK